MTTLILGGGITGLLAAYYLQERGEATEVWEAEEAVGGWVKTLPWATEDGRPGRIEKGPQGVLVTPGSRTDTLFRALDLQLKSPGKGARWVGTGGRLVPVPAHPVGLFGTALMSWSTKFRMCFEPFMPVRPAEPEEGLSEFMARRAGQGIATELLPPMVAGILASPAELLSVDAIPKLRQWEAYGSLLQGIMKSGVSHLQVPEGGMGSLPVRVASRLAAVKTGLRAESLERTADGRWLVKGDGLERVADRVLLALPAFDAARLLAPHAEASAKALAEIPYTSVKLWHSRHAPLAPFKDGFGFLIHPKEGRPYLGSLVPSWIDAGCAPGDRMQLRSFIGDSDLWRDPDPGAAKDWAWTLGRLRNWVPALSDAYQTREEISPNAIPRAEKGHRGRVRRAVEGLPQGIHWLSNARFGPGVRDVIEGLEPWLDTL
ncbi:NAD(P)/FAD-dependent oxidoreductase [Geothrix sp. 21YS21S-2]|uniref:protoporphyrinogen/coproporphyrinogen oxidase n=1 Tax=Geothrix sp. 21YS21S-2 TaxID=3068893 RepID=UPI0027BA6B4A|nr:FAD-dependent oxidoreductase [Geothrix sp. 21YS21S-2]